MTGKIIPDIVENQTLHTLSKSSTTLEAANLMATNRISAILVTESDKLVGIVTERDLTAKVLAGKLNPESAALADIMTANPDVLDPSDSPISALELMRLRGYRHLPVVEDGCPVGIVSIRDLYAAAKDQLEEDIRQREAFIFDTGYGAGS
ncbi:MAG: CBS domain-containing protein [Rhodospirillales bacterium]|jgi:CBS domain-containing protein|nr:CBS domain-containing protein [Rhodospirillales bacterium]